MKVAVVGASGHAKVVADALLTAGEHEFVGFLDDDSALWGSCVFGRPVLGSIEQWSSQAVDGFIIGIGDNRARRHIFEKILTGGGRFCTVVHPSAVIGTGVRLGQGIVVLANVVVNCDAVIHDNAILNTACSVDHDSMIGAHTHLAPGVHLAGGVNIGEGAFLGIGARVLPNVSVGNWAIVGAGAVVTRDVQDKVTVVGTPARTVK